MALSNAPPLRDGLRCATPNTTTQTDVKPTPNLRLALLAFWRFGGEFSEVDLSAKKCAAKAAALGEATREAVPRRERRVLRGAMRERERPTLCSRQVREGSRSHAAWLRTA